MVRRARIAAAVVLGSALATRFAAAEPGDLDLRFGRGGFVTTRVGADPAGVARARDVAIQPDGRIVAAGFARKPKEISFFRDPEFAVVRYLPSGSLDRSFGAGGIATAVLRGLDSAAVVVIQPDGKIVAAGRAGYHITFVLTQGMFGLARFGADGQLDQGFGEGGTVATRFFSSGLFAESAIHAISILPDGKIVAVGYTTTGPASGPGGMAVARYDPGGSLDPAFGGQGKVVTPFDGEPGDFSEAMALRSHPDGRLTVAGAADRASVPPNPRPPSTHFALARYRPDGSLEDSFGASGKVEAPIPGWPTAMTFQPDGKVVAIGGPVAAPDAGPPGWFLARYTADGSPDPTFGVDGVVISDVAGPDTFPGGVAVDPMGRVVAAGGVVPASYSELGDFVVARFLADGGVDETFGNGGVAATAGANAEPAALAIQADGRIVVAGQALVTGIPQFALARYLGDEPPPPVAPRFRGLSPGGPGLPPISR